ncbi:MAG: phosphodiester glycosidase family protein [Archangium sp.]
MRCFVLLALVALPALAQDTWTEPFPGVRMLERVSPSLRVFAVEVKLDTPGLTLRSTMSNERKQTVSSFAEKVGASVAVNADFFSFDDYSTEGLSVGNGEPWKDTHDTVTATAFAFGEGRVQLFERTPITVFDERWMKGVVSGGPELLRDGVVQSSQQLPVKCFWLHPRTALGLSPDKKKLILAVVDGRSSKSTGVSCRALSKLMLELGAWNAMNLDGGGSSTLWVKGRGVVNTPSDGVERVVGNHLAVILAP